MNKRLVLLLGIIQLLFTLEAQNIQLVFRYDDFMLKSDSLNEGVVRVFQKHHIPLVLGVIPFDAKEKKILEKDYSFLPILKQGVSDQSIEIALHGLNHSKVSNGEFGNVAIDEQYRRIHKGRVILDSIFQTKVVAFIPPWNAYDVNTLQTLDSLGFKTLSSALCIGQPFSNPTINYYPHTLGSFKVLMPGLENNKNREGIIVLMFHSYDFNQSFTLDSLDHALTVVRKLPYVNCTTFKGLNAAHIVSDADRISANMEIDLLTKMLRTDSMIQTTTFSTLVRVANVFIYLLISLVIFMLCALLFRLKSAKMNITYIVLSVFLGFSIWFHLLSPMKLMILALVSPLLVACIFKMITTKLFKK